MLLVRRGGAVALALVVLFTACADPPEKEMHEARGAIDAARAAGAELYAPDEYTAAIAALDRAQNAVAQRDYRLALSHALDAREQARQAARRAASQKAAVRSDAERAIAESEAALTLLDSRLQAAQSARVPARQLAATRSARASGQAALQKARAALAREDFLGARDTMSRVAERLRAATSQLDAALAARTGRRRR